MKKKIETVVMRIVLAILLVFPVIYLIGIRGRIPDEILYSAVYYHSPQNTPREVAEHFVACVCLVHTGNLDLLIYG